MSGRRLLRETGAGRTSRPSRIVHLGLGNFFRAHQCWYTEHSPDAADWGIVAFTGRRGSDLVGELTRQDGLYTLVARGNDRDRFEIVGSLSRAHAARESEAWLRAMAAPELAAVTVTVTEAGYLRGHDGGLDAMRAEVQADIAALRADPTGPARTAPGRLLAGVAARRAADGGPFALVPCDNTPGNGALARRVVHELAEIVDPDLATWFAQSVSVVTTMVDRITPATTDEDIRIVAETTQFDDRCPVVGEPFAEWVLSGAFPAGRPQWDSAGATFTDDVTPYEHRKLWLLNGAHSLLAYAGSIRGHATVARAIDDDSCRSWVREWWTIASAHLDQPEADLAAYRSALLQRFANARMNDRLDRIAADGSQKLPIRIIPVLRSERAAGRLPAGATRVLAAWICHLRGLGAPVNDARSDAVVPLAGGELADAVPRLLDRLDPGLGGDADVVALVVEQSTELASETGPR